ncbi:hypothetical protein L1987_33311 [Smallanthus sonchifolius]|uniref:Uncharacterized protein n=1 Tax=Smallanthus sonchifolius TaxID=185202 RepID=A0ACB9HQG8_9ASTR|nr:hypothetical protein L1987_33311 [Smallanthus sonchifolius]
MRLPSPRQHQTPLREVGGPSTPIVGIPVGRLPPRSWERDYLTVERVCQLHDQGFEHEMRLHHHQNLMDQVISQLSATHIELHQARNLIEDAMWDIRGLRMKIVVWGLVVCVLFVLLLYDWTSSVRCWLCMASSSDSSADESGYVVARLPFPRAAYMTATQRQDLRKCQEENPLTQNGHLQEHKKGKHVTRLDFHTDLATDMSGQMSEMEQDIMQNHDRSTTALKEARAARVQSRVAIAVALVVSLASLFLQFYR